MSDLRKYLSWRRGIIGQKCIREDTEMWGCCALWALFAGLCDFVHRCGLSQMQCSDSHSVYSWLLFLVLDPTTTSQLSTWVYCQFKKQDQLLWSLFFFVVVYFCFVQPRQTAASSEVPVYSQDACFVMYRQLHFRPAKCNKGLVALHSDMLKAISMSFLL